MIKGPARFDYYLTKVQVLLNKAATQKNPALWLYKNDLRTPMFMLEALAKMYACIHNKKKFTTLKAHFKLLEDTIGAIDYYDNISKDLSANKNMPATIITYLQAQTREKIQSLNEILAEKKWLATSNNRIQKIQNKLAGADWLKEEKEVNAINEFYGKAIYEITEFVHAHNCIFKDIEADVHELRRKLRWLSIYPQALRGSVQLSDNKVVPEQLTKYLTKEITTSTFNKMPDAGDSNYFLLLQQNYFYALSWMIAELGKIKDKGLHAVAVKEALQQTTDLDDEAAYKKTYQLTGAKQTKVEQLLADASTICKAYFDEQNLEHLVVGVKKVKYV